MIPLSALPLEPATHRAIAETIADGRHEWLQAQTPFARASANIRFTFAITRTLVTSSMRELKVALGSQAAWMWFAFAVIFTGALFLMTGRARGGAPRAYAYEFCLMFLTTTPVTVYASALMGRRTTRVPVGGLAVFVTGVFGLALTVALPIAQARFFTQFSNGRSYMALPWTVFVGFGLPCLLLSVLALLFAERARRHERRAFLSILGFLLPIGAIAVTMRFRIGPTGGPWGFGWVLLTAAMPLAMMWLVLVRQSHPQGANT